MTASWAATDRHLSNVAHDCRLGSFITIANGALLGGHVILGDRAVLGGGAGLGTAWLIVTTGGDPTNGFLPAFYIQTKDLVLGVLLVIAVGAVSGALPAMQAYRLENIVALRKVA